MLPRCDDVRVDAPDIAHAGHSHDGLHGSTNVFNISRTRCSGVWSSFMVGSVDILYCWASKHGRVVLHCGRRREVTSVSFWTMLARAIGYYLICWRVRKTFPDMETVGFRADQLIVTGIRIDDSVMTKIVRFHQHGGQHILQLDDC